MELSDIKYSTPLESILNSDEVETLVSDETKKMMQYCSTKNGVLFSNMKEGRGLSTTNVLGGKPIYNVAAGELTCEYSSAIDPIQNVNFQVSRLAWERELSELQTLRERVMERNRQIQTDITNFNNEYENADKGTGQKADIIYDNYYGIDGSVTKKKAELAENEDKIYQINVRISKVNGGSAVYKKLSSDDKKLMDFQDAKGTKDSDWKEVETSGNVKRYTYTTSNNTKVEKIVVDDSKVAYYTVYTDGKKYYFDNSGNELNEKFITSLGKTFNFKDGTKCILDGNGSYTSTEGKSGDEWFSDDAKSATDFYGNYTYNKEKGWQSDYSQNLKNSSKSEYDAIVSVSEGKVAYYTIIDTDGNRTYYDSNYNRIFPAQVDKIVADHGLSKAHVVREPGVYWPEPTCDPTEPPTTSTDSVPDTTTSDTTVPDSTVPDSTVPETTVPEPTVPTEPTTEPTTAPVEESTVPAVTEPHE